MVEKQHLFFDLVQTFESDFSVSSDYLIDSLGHLLKCSEII